MNEIEVKVWMLKKGIRQARIAREVGVSETLVCHTLKNKEKNRRVIKWLIDHGCPRNLLVDEAKLVQLPCRGKRKSQKWAFS